MNSPATFQQRRGAALIIVLAFVVLLSGIAVAYLSRTTGDRQLAHGTFSENRADILARSALDVVVGDLKQEIVNGSASPAPTYGPASSPSYLYSPTSSSYIIPVPNGTPSDQSIPNLVKRSFQNDNPASPAISSRASQVSSTAVSLNGRSITPARWNKHYLIPRVSPTPSADSDTTPTSSFTPPDWVLVTRNGPAPQTAIGSGSTALNNSTASNPNYVVGRYAYTIYDEGGLLDLNVAGYPSPAPSPVTYVSTVGHKGMASFADLTTSGMSSGGINDLVGWRSYASVQPSGSFSSFSFDSNAANRYLTAIFLNTNGFMTVGATVWNNGTDQAFTSRQALLEFQRSIGFTVAALPYLGTFSRETTTPSWAPDYDASQRGGSSATAYKYKTNSGITTSVNRDLGTVRVVQNSTPAFARQNGSSAFYGEPLVKNRFPLSRLAWITYKGPSASLAIGHDVDPSVTTPATSDSVILALVNSGVSLTTIRAGTAGNIKTNFGLVWDSRGNYVPASGTSAGQGQQWVYTSPSSANAGGNFDPVSNPGGTAATVIKTLNTVQSEAREPDFFELLQACIFTGSLAQNTGGGTTNTNGSGATAESPVVFPDYHMSSSAFHVMKIGAAIIDEADPDSIPTRIRIDQASEGWLACGVENLPYISGMCPIGGKSPDDATNMKFASYLLFQLWNPNEAVAGTRQFDVRLRIDGGIGIFTRMSNGTQTWSGTPQVIANGSAAGQSVKLNTTAPFALNPAPLMSTNVNGYGSSLPAFVSVPSGAIPAPIPGPASGTTYVGYRMPDFTLSAASGSAKPQLWLQIGAANGSTPTPFNATLEYYAGKDASNNDMWVPYNRFVGIDSTGTWARNAPLRVREAFNKTGVPDATKDAFVPIDTSSPAPYSWAKSDPRSTRFGVVQLDKNNSNSSSDNRIDVLLWEQNNNNYKNGFGGTIGTDVEHVPLLFKGNKPYLPATLCLNIGSSSNTATGYVDVDGVQRYGDTGYSPQNGSGNAQTPYDNTSLQYEPVVLNRPFQNVGELGYAFRDLPWRSLDFFTANSADAGLLDVFSITDEPFVIAGRVSLNTRQAPVIQAVMQKGLWDEYDTGNLIGLTQASGFCHSNTMANNYASYIIQKGTLFNRSSLATALYGSSNVIANAVTTAVLRPANGVGHENEAAKTRREAVARSITSMSQTRTWNLMIDVIAQSGKYPPTANDLSQFVVEGEKRYWLHIAIDRFTGEVIDQQLEAVYE
jgi:hypothetical protein